MSNAEYASKIPIFFRKLAVMLRNVPAVRFAVAKVSALLGNHKASDEKLIGQFPGEVPDVTGNTFDQPVAVLESSGDLAVAGSESADPFERETLIRRRWAETGIKMWNPDVHGAGKAALNIQGQAQLLPAKPGETLAAYDKLEFKVVRSYIDGQAVNRIVCEGFVVDPPKRRR